MPFNIEVRRGDKKLKTQWDFFVLSCCLTAAYKEDAPDRYVNDDVKYGDIPDGTWVDFSMAPIYLMDGCSLLELGTQTLHNDHSFESVFPNQELRQFELKKGDIINCWRD